MFWSIWITRRRHWRRFRDCSSLAASSTWRYPTSSSLQSCSTGKNWFHLDLEHHLYHFSPNGLHQLLLSTGFKVEKTTTLSLEQGPYGVLQSWLNATGREHNKLYRILKRGDFSNNGCEAWTVCNGWDSGFTFPILCPHRSSHRSRRSIESGSEIRIRRSTSWSHLNIKNRRSTIVSPS